MSAGEDFCKSLLDALTSPSERLRLAAALVKWQGCTIHLPVDSKKERRIRAAQRMLENGMGGPEIVDVLRERFGVTARTGQRDVESARKMSA